MHIETLILKLKTLGARMKDVRVDQGGDSPWARICAMERRRSSVQADLSSGGDFSSLRRGRGFDGSSAVRWLDAEWLPMGSCVDDEVPPAQQG
ncbi:hypothetical protein M6B38_163455 [Iris pallida]|uniref:Uncharacterized protein n=1 Tax=Iris pallida TaxID=29817 RepID=A0AAX6EYF7_IRIPA|nr:hypothetical protein M6B38_163455 [Iris pallida]